MAAAIMSMQLVDQSLALPLSPDGSVSIDIVAGTPDSPKAAQGNGCREVTSAPQSSDSIMSSEHVRLGNADSADSDAVMQAVQPVPQTTLQPPQEATAPMHNESAQGIVPQSPFDEQAGASANGLDNSSGVAVQSSVAASAHNASASEAIAPSTSGSSPAAGTELKADTLARTASADVAIDDGWPAASLVDHSGDDEPLVSMLSQSQEMPASAQRSDSLNEPSMEPHASVQSQLDNSPGAALGP